MKGTYLPNLWKTTNFQLKEPIWPKPRKTRYISFFCRIHSMADPKKAAKSGILSPKEVCCCCCCCVASTPDLDAIGIILLPKTKLPKEGIWLHREVLLFCNTFSVQEDNPTLHYIVEMKQGAILLMKHIAITMFPSPIFLHIGWQICF